MADVIQYLVKSLEMTRQMPEVVEMVQRMKVIIDKWLEGKYTDLSAKDMALLLTITNSLGQFIWITLAIKQEESGR